MTTTVVVMGVSGSGKTTVGTRLAAARGWPFLDADDLHPPANVDAMRSGRPLTEAQRDPWLAAVAAWIGDRERAGEDAVVACSALRRAHRDRLRAGHPSVRFLHLDVPAAELRARLARRAGHFMPASLLDSQLAALEPLEPDEPVEQPG